MSDYYEMKLADLEDELVECRKNMSVKCKECGGETKDNRVWGVYEDDYGTEARETLKKVGELNNTHKEQSNK